MSANAIERLHENTRELARDLGSLGTDPVNTYVGWCPYCYGPVKRITTTDGRGFCSWEPVLHGLVWPVRRVEIGQ